MPARRQLLQKITLTADVLSVTFSNIPQNYTDLVVLTSARSSRTGTSWVTPSITFNAASNSTDYSGIVLRGDGSSASSFGAVSAGYNGIAIGVCPSAGITANTFDNIQVTIPNYTSSTQKSILAVSGSENNGTTGFNQVVGGRWTGTAAITSLTVWANGNVGGHAYTVGSTFYLYGITQVPVIVGGTETISGGYKIHTFTATSSLRVVEGGPVEYLVVAGGGAGGPSATPNDWGGGGGAGGYRSSVAGEASGGGALGAARLVLTSGTTHTVTVGAGGSGAAAGHTSGSNSVLSDITATGGGRAGGLNTTPAWLLPQTGGSGGGSSDAEITGAAGTAGQGFAGGNSLAGGNGGGGGGGAGSAGSNATSNSGGNGGSGVTSSITGTAVARAGGGGGAGSSGAGTAVAGGGAGSTSTTGTDGIANTGGGGGGGTRSAGNGGSGVVIIRYPYITN